MLRLFQRCERGLQAGAGSGTNKPYRCSLAIHWTLLCPQQIYHCKGKERSDMSEEAVGTHAVNNGREAKRPKTDDQTHQDTSSTSSRTSADDKEARSNTVSFFPLPDQHPKSRMTATHLELMVLTLLDQHDLYCNFSAVSQHCHLLANIETIQDLETIRRNGRVTILPQGLEGVFTLDRGGDLTKFLQTLSLDSCDEAFSSYWRDRMRIKIPSDSNFHAMTLKALKPLIKGVKMYGPSKLVVEIFNEGNNDAEDTPLEPIKKLDLVLKVLMQVLPNVRDVDLTKVTQINSFDCKEFDAFAQEGQDTTFMQSAEWQLCTRRRQAIAIPPSLLGRALHGKCCLYLSLCPTFNVRIGQD